MSSNDFPLHQTEKAESLPVVSDDVDLRDAGEPVSTTSAAPVGCWAYEAEPKSDVQTQDSVAGTEPVGCWAENGEQPAEPDDDVSVSVNAPGGTSDNSLPEPKTAADAIKSHRDFEAFLRASGFSRAASKALAKSGWQAIGEVETDASSEEEAMMAQELIALLKRPGSR